MKETVKCSCDQGTCGCGCGEMGKHFFLRMLLGLIIIIVVFSLGMMVGEVKGALRSGEYQRRSDTRVMMTYPDQMMIPSDL